MPMVQPKTKIETSWKYHSLYINSVTAVERGHLSYAQVPGCGGKQGVLSMHWTKEGRSTKVRHSVRARVFFTCEPIAWALGEPHKAPLTPTCYPASLSMWSMIKTRESGAFVIQRGEQRGDVLLWQQDSANSEIRHFFNFLFCIGV